MLKVLYVNIHYGTRMLFDAMAEFCGWTVVHVSPNHAYAMSDELADEVWERYYKPIVTKECIDLIVVGDITLTCGYPFLRHMSDIPNHVHVILQITKYFYYGNDTNLVILKQFREYVNDNLRVHIVYVDPFIHKILRENDIITSHMKHIPLTGRVTTKRYKCEFCPSLATATTYLYPPDNADPFYYDSQHLEPSHNVAWIERTNTVLQAYIRARDGMCNFDILQHNKYGGPFAIQKYHTVIYIPYHYSTVTVLETMSMGVNILVPSPYLFSTHINTQLDTSLMCVYHGPMAHLITTFDSWLELDDIISSINSMSDAQKEKDKRMLQMFMKAYDESIYTQWVKFIATCIQSHIQHLGASDAPTMHLVPQETKPDIPDMIYTKPHVRYLLKHKKCMDEAVRQYAPKKSRYYTFKTVLEYLSKVERPVIIELGTSRSFVNGYIENDPSKWNPHDNTTWDHGAGVFTLVIAEALNAMNKASYEIHSVDISKEAIATSAHMTSHLPTRSYLHHYLQSSTEFLNAFKGRAHVIYMDHAESHDHWVHTLHEHDARIIVEKDMLYDRGMILVDDMFDHTTCKGKLSIPYLLSNGFEMIANEYQILLQKK